MHTTVKRRKRWLWALVVLLAALIIHSFWPLPRGSAANCAVVQGIVVEIKPGGGPADILVKLSGEDGYYYINRGLENGVNLQTLNNQLLHKTAKLYYIKHWSLLNSNGKTRHIARIESGQEVAYNEWSQN